MTKAPVISVLLPSYNNKQYLADAIESVINQTEKGWELIISDDASTDGSFELAQTYTKKDKRIKVFKNETNLGNPKNRNMLLGYAHPEARFVAILDSDDTMLPERLEMQKRFLEKHPSIGLVGSAIYIIDEHDNIRGIRRYPADHKDIKKDLLIFDPFAQPAVMMVHQALALVGKYDEKLLRCQDYDLFIRFVKAGIKTANINKPLTNFRVTDTQGKYQSISRAFKYSFVVRNRYLFTKEFFSIHGLGMWVVYGVGHVAAKTIPPKVFRFIFNKLFVKKPWENE